MGRKVKLRLASRIGYVDLVHEVAEDLARSARFPKPEALNVGLAVREAFINAIKHGNQMDEGKRVVIEFELNGERFRVRERPQAGCDPRVDERAGDDGDHAPRHARCPVHRLHDHSLAIAPGVSETRW